MNKIYIADKKEFIKFKKNHWKDDGYTQYIISTPDEFPCVALERIESDGMLGECVLISEFVYLSDFKKYNIQTPKERI